MTAVSLVTPEYTSGKYTPHRIVTDVVVDVSSTPFVVVTIAVYWPDAAQAFVTIDPRAKVLSPKQKRSASA